MSYKVISAESSASAAEAAQELTIDLQNITENVISIGGGNGIGAKGKIYSVYALIKI